MRMQNKRMAGLLCLLWLITILPLPSVSIAEMPVIGPYDLVVSPFGDDANVGTLTSPLRTVAEAKQRMRAVDPDTEATVWLREGTYALTEPLTFTMEDRANTAYRAYPGENAVISGAQTISSWRETTMNGVTVWAADVSDLAPFNALYHDRVGSLQRARYPKVGYLHVGSARASDAADEKSEAFAMHSAFYVDTKEAGGDFAAFEKPNEVLVRLLHYWKDELATVASYSRSSGRLTLSRPTSMTVKKGDRYYFENVREALTIMGEWYLDSQAQMLYYVPLFGERMENVTLYAGQLTRLLEINDIDGLRFEGITFTRTDWAIPNDNQTADFAQAAYDVEPAIRARFTRGLTFANCTFTYIGGTCLELEQYTENATVTGCLFQNIGANALVIEGLHVVSDHPFASRNIRIADNHICAYGRNFFGAVGILVINTRDSAIEHNEIHDGYYSAISAGWTWGYAYNATEGLAIRYNLIHTIGQGLLSDMGGIYLLGIQPHTQVKGNVIHDVRTYEGGYGGWGIYLDEGSSLMEITENLVYGCSSHGFHLHYGASNLVTNNVFAYNGMGQVAISETKEQVSCILHTNILVGPADTLLTGRVKDVVTTYNNLFWDPNSPDKILSVLESTGHAAEARIGDPLFLDPANGDYRLRPDSPAYVLGFLGWNIEQAGTYTDFQVH